MDFGVRCQVHELWCTLALVTESLSGLPGVPFTEVLNVTDRSDPSLQGYLVLPRFGAGILR